MKLELTKKQASNLETLRTQNARKGKKIAYSANYENPPKVLSKKAEIPYLSADTDFVHFSFRPTIADICILLDACPRINKIQAPPHVIYALSDTVLHSLRLKKIEVSEGSITEPQKFDKRILLRRSEN